MGQIKQAMILAAGLGLRARPLTSLKPKPLLPVLNRSIISHTLDLLAEAGVERVVINTHHLADLVAAETSGRTGGPSIEILYEDQILGTGGGLKNAAPLFDRSPIIVINGAILTRIDLGQVIQDHQAHAPLATMVHQDNQRFNNVLVRDDGRILGFRFEWEDEPLARDRRVLAFTGIHIVEPEALDNIPEGPGDIIHVYQALIRSGAAIRAFTVKNPVWWKVETVADYLQIHADLLARRTRGSIFTGPGVRVEPGARLQGWVCLGEGVIIETGAVVRNSVCWKGARIKSGVQVADSVVTEDVTLSQDLFAGVGLD